MTKLTKEEYDAYRARGYTIKINRVYEHREGLEVSVRYELDADYVVVK